MALAWGIAFVVLALVSGVILRVVVRDHRVTARRALILTRPTTPIADARGSVYLKGTVSAGDEGTCRAPLSGREVVWSRTTFAFHRPHSRSTKWADAVFDKRRRRFHLSDATGTAEVELQGGVAFIPTQAELEFDLTRGGKLPPPLDEILQTSPGLPQGAVWRVRIREERIEPGMELSVSGRIAHVPGESADRVFRDGPSQRARIVGHPDEELVAFSDAGFFEREIAKERWGMWLVLSMTVGSSIAGAALVAYACVP